MYLKNLSTKDLARRLVEIKKEEQDIMLELWRRAPSLIDEVEKGEDTNVKKLQKSRSDSRP